MEILPAHIALQVLEDLSFPLALNTSTCTCACVRNERGRAESPREVRMHQWALGCQKALPTNCISLSTNLRRSMASPTCCKSIHAPGRWNLRRHETARRMSVKTRWAISSVCLTGRHKLCSVSRKSWGELLVGSLCRRAGHSDPGSAWEPTAPSSSSACGRRGSTNRAWVGRFGALGGELWGLGIFQKYPHRQRRSSEILRS